MWKHAIVILALAGVAQATANVPLRLSHQGRVFDQTGYPLEGSVDVEYALYGSPTGGTSLWTENESPEVVDGFFASVLGDQTPFRTEIFDGRPLFLSIKVNGEELLPRTSMVSVPYAFVAQDAVGDIHPRSVTVGGHPVIDANGKWIGDPSGLVGPAGADGATGPQGPQGPAGAIGATGPQGPAGADGAAGVAGPIGLTGPIGPQGVAGLACWDANQNGVCDLPSEDHDSSSTCDVSDCLGPSGAIGPIGPQGPAGAVGPQGPQGLTGADGATGPMGPQGPAGAIGPQGSDGPMGPQGPAGLDGPAGPTGPMGPQGTAGLDGATGPMGPQGPQGTAGLDGATGPMGPQGPAGLDGLDGATGPMGPQGPQGSQGVAGPEGPSGGGVVLKDANNVTLGKVLSVGTSLSGVGYTPQHFAFVTIQTSTKHIISMGLDGVAAFGQVYWNGGGCGSGQAILNTGTSSASRKGFCKLVVRTASGALMSTGSGCDANGLVDSVQIAGVTNIESTGSCSGSSSTNFGFLLTTVANTDIGLPASIALPLSY